MPTKKSSTTQKRRSASDSAAQTKKKASAATAKKPAAKASATKTTRSSPSPVETEQPAPNPDRLLHQIIPYIFVVAAIFLLVCFILTDAVGLERPMGVIGYGLRSLLCGLWSWAAFYIPLVLLYFAVIWRRTIAERTTGYKAAFSLICLTLCAALIETFTLRSTEPGNINPITLWQEGCALRGGGVIGGLVGQLCYRGFGFVGTLIVVIALLLIFILFFIGLTPSSILLYLRYAIKVRAEKKAARANEQPIFLNQQPKINFPAQSVQQTEQTPSSVQPARGRRRFDLDVPVDEKSKLEDIDLPIPDPPDGTPTDEPQPEVAAPADDNPIDPAIFDEVLPGDAAGNAPRKQRCTPGKTRFAGENGRALCGRRDTDCNRRRRTG